jgi:predicted GH43/DUF377 family glycosyl hydrolase
MSWQKEGQIFTPENYRSDWMASHAAVPTVKSLGGDQYRVYFSPRDINNHSTIGYFEIDLNNPHKILMVSKEPVLQSGKLGNFDDAGAMASWLVNCPGEEWLYYIGWNVSVDVPFRNSLGLAISRDNGRTFNRFSGGPVLDRSIYDPAFVASACVLRENDKWRMWYLSGLSWELRENGYQHKYHIKYAESEDGVKWNRSGHVCIDFKDDNEYAISRPCVIKESGIYRMWYSYRGEKYRIGYAESHDGLDWIRKDKDVGIDISSSGWDSEMIEYPYVFQSGSRKIMLYNGNGYGLTGIGYAVLNE